MWTEPDLKRLLDDGGMSLPGEGGQRVPVSSLFSRYSSYVVSVITVLHALPCTRTLPTMFPLYTTRAGCYMWGNSDTSVQIVVLHYQIGSVAVKLPYRVLSVSPGNGSSMFSLLTF